ncbi:hypothetical protein GQ53DRAFT_745278 [Thozetella sp. PMI_491]|nr:hypothetical protein GQ53DRAFT_745278 [Thozetella sp. PMI_491]
MGILLACISAVQDFFSAHAAYAIVSVFDEARQYEPAVPLCLVRDISEDAAAPPRRWWPHSSCVSAFAPHRVGLTVSLLLFIFFSPRLGGRASRRQCLR